jgi:hypothetical protein
MQPWCVSSGATTCSLDRWSTCNTVYVVDSIGRGGRIRTADPLRPRRFPAFVKVPYFQRA